MKSEASLCTGGSIGVMKLNVQPLESAFGVDHQDSKGEVFWVQVYGWCDHMS